MSYQEWWSLPVDLGFSLVALRRAIASTMKVEGLRLGVGYVPCQPEVIVPAVEEGRIDICFCVPAHQTLRMARALDEELAGLLDSELRALDALAEDEEPDEHCVLSVSLQAAKEGWEGPRMLLTDETHDNQRLWALACLIAHVLARVLGARLIDPQEPWPLWDPDAVLTVAS